MFMPIKNTRELVIDTKDTVKWHFAKCNHSNVILSFWSTLKKHQVNLVLFVPNAARKQQLHILCNVPAAGQYLTLSGQILMKRRLFLMFPSALIVWEQ